MANDLLRRQQSVVADVIDRYARTDRSPLTSFETQLSGRAPGFRFDSMSWFAQQRLFRRIEEPSPASVECDAEVLRLADVDRATDRLGAGVSDVDLDHIIVHIGDGLDVAICVNGVQFAIGRAGCTAVATGNAILRDFDEISRLMEIRQPYDCPFDSGAFFAPKNLSRAVGIAIERARIVGADICVVVPRLVDVDSDRTDTTDPRTSDTFVRQGFE